MAGRRGSIELPKGLDRLARAADDAATGLNSADTSETVKRLGNVKSRVESNMDLLESEIHRVRQREQIATLARSSSRKLKRHATIGAAPEDEDVITPLATAGASLLGNRRTSFVDEKTLARAHRYTETELSTEANQMKELTKWLNTEMITRTESERSMVNGTNGARPSLRQVLKVDDRIDLDDYRHKKYTELEIDAEEKKKEEEETKRKGSKEGNGKAAVLRHTKSYRRQTIE